MQTNLNKAFTDRFRNELQRRLESNTPPLYKSVATIQITNLLQQWNKS